MTFVRASAAPSHAPSTRRAVLLDEYALWLDALADLLERLGIDVVGKATDPERALQLLETVRPDVFVAEIAMKRGSVDGLTCVRRGVQQVPGLRAVVLSVFADREHIEGALAAGAVTYVVKTAHPDDLAFAVKQALGDSRTSRRSVYLPVAWPAASSRRPRRAARRTPLTPREEQISGLVSEGRSDAEIAEILALDDAMLADRLAGICRKLGVAERADVGRWAQLNGGTRPLLRAAG